MEILKDVLGEDLFNQVMNKINGNEQIILANIADGSYIEKSKYEQDIKKIKYDSALDSALEKSGARNTKVLKALIDENSLSFDDEGLHGFDEQLAVLKKECDYLFEQQLAGGISHSGTVSFVSGIEESFYQKNPDIIKKNRALK